MGILDKLSFWKHKEPEPSPAIGDLPSEQGMPLGSDIGGAPAPPGFETPGGPTGMEAQPEEGFRSTPEKPFPTLEPTSSQPSPLSPQPVSPQPLQQQDDIFTVSKNIEVVSSKVDALKAVLDSINQRLSHIEKIAEGEEKEKPRYGRW